MGFLEHQFCCIPVASQHVLIVHKSWKNVYYEKMTIPSTPPPHCNSFKAFEDSESIKYHLSFAYCR